MCLLLRSGSVWPSYHKGLIGGVLQRWLSFWKCFESLVKDHITSTLPDTLDPLQFAYRPNRSTDDAIAITLHTTLTHLKRNTYVRMLFIDYSSGFNTMVPSKLVIKLETIDLDPAPCN